MSAKPLFREFIRELRLINRSYKSLKESPAYQFVAKSFRQNQVTTEQTCKAREESQYMAQTYLCYLKSSRRAAELRNEFHGQGERSVRSTADMVGFKLPHDPK